jgi:CheY-like chemotaxis protein
MMSELTKPGATPLQGVRILVVEDETMLFFLAEDMLTELGCSAVLHASRVTDALALLARELPDVAMLDVNLGGEQAYPIAEKLAELKVPFVFATGYGSEGITTGWTGRPVVQKPFTLEMLARAVTVALASKNQSETAG